MSSSAKYASAYIGVVPSLTPQELCGVIAPGMLRHSRETSRVRPALEDDRVKELTVNLRIAPRATIGLAT